MTQQSAHSVIPPVATLGRQPVLESFAVSDGESFEELPGDDCGGCDRDSSADGQRIDSGALYPFLRARSPLTTEARAKTTSPLEERETRNRKLLPSVRAPRPITRGSDNPYPSGSASEAAVLGLEMPDFFFNITAFEELEVVIEHLAALVTAFQSDSKDSIAMTPHRAVNRLRG